MYLLEESCLFTDKQRAADTIKLETGGADYNHGKRWINKRCALFLVYRFDYDPPQVLLSTNMKRDTYRNIRETMEFVANFPDTSLLRQTWVTSKHFPYGVNELERAGLASFPSEKVKPPRIKKCKAHMECRVLWTKPIGSTSLVLGEVVSVSANKEIEKLGVKNRMVMLDPPLYFSFGEEEGKREWMFAEIGRIATITEKDEKIKITSENL